MKWEYQCVAMKKNWVETLNEYGKAGWELVDVHFFGDDLLAFFKRRLPE